MCLKPCPFNMGQGFFDGGLMNSNSLTGSLKTDAFEDLLEQSLSINKFEAISFDELHRLVEAISCSGGVVFETSRRE